MGQRKAALKIGGEPLLSRVVGSMRAALGEVLVIGPSDLRILAPAAKVRDDLRGGLGPLSGLETALTAIEEDGATHAFVVACDMPFLSTSLIRYMTSLAESGIAADAVVLRSIQGPEYLHAVYAVTCLPAIRARLDSGERSLRGFVGALRLRVVEAEEALRYDPSGMSAFNANTPEEWRRALVLEHSTGAI